MRLVFVLSIENEFSTDIGSIKQEDIFNLRLNLDIKLIGMTGSVKTSMKKDENPVQ